MGINMRIMRHFIVAALALLLSGSAFAQDIAGKWTSSNQSSQDGFEVKMDNTLELASAGAFRQEIVMEMLIPDEDGVRQRLKFKVSTDGKWEYADKVLTYRVDPKTVAAEVVDIPAGVPKFLVNMLTKSVVSQMKKEASKPIRDKVLTLTVDSLKTRNLNLEKAEVVSMSRVK